MAKTVRPAGHADPHAATVCPLPVPAACLPRPAALSPHLSAGLACRGSGTEWELLKQAKPRFPGHLQPNVPQWGYEMDNDPAVMAKKIDAAADNGVDHFIFDWYWYNETDGVFQDGGTADFY